MSKDFTPRQQDDPEQLWKMIDELQKEVNLLRKYKVFHDMLRLSNTPIGADNDTEN